MTELPINQIIRVFPRRTVATPNDQDVVIGRGPLSWDKPSAVHISVAFTWDLPKAEKLLREWQRIAPAEIGGPATGTAGGDFEPGVYIRRGYVITSRGCPNRCWFCSVWRREGSSVRELPIRDGWNILDDNLLACSESHIRDVFVMLRRQPEPIEFTGGWEAKRLKPWHVDLLTTIRLQTVWFAYDEDADLEPLVEAGKLLRQAGLSVTKTGAVSHRVRCYCLVGWPKDTMDAADKRLRIAYQNGFLPFAMLFRDSKGQTEYEWRRFQKAWARAASVNRMCRTGIDAKAVLAKRQHDFLGQNTLW